MNDLKNMSIGVLKAKAKDCWNKFADIPTFKNYNEYSVYKKELGARGIVLDYVPENERGLE